MTSVPPELQYNRLLPRGFASSFKPWPIEPISNGQFYPGQVIKIFLNALTSGVLDPYRSHIEIVVSSDINSLPVGKLQVDSSAQSFIQQLVITSRNREVERIIEYGVLANYLVDIGLSELFSEGKEVEGLGYTNIDSFSQGYTPQTNGSYSTIFGEATAGGWNTIYPISSPGTVFPTIPKRFIQDYAYGDQTISFSSLNMLNRSHVSYLNPSWLTYTDVWWWMMYTGEVPMTNQTPANLTSRQINVKYYGYVNNVRAEYLQNVIANKYPDSTTSQPNYEIRVSGLGNVFPPKFSNGTSYQVYVPDSTVYYWNDISTTPGNNSQMRSEYPNVTSLNGFTSLYSPLFCRGGHEPFISPTVPQCQMQNGLILPTKIPISQRKFKIPLISAVMGLLIPQSQFILLPLEALNDLYLEFTIDPAAMFTSGYNDVSEYDNIGMGLMQKRNFTVQRFIYNLHTYQFFNPSIDEYIKANLNSGIAINVNMWQLGNEYQIENGQSVTNAWNVACTEEALNEILTLFVPSDYQMYSFCRKHFRISNNITKFQIRINMDYFPSQPISGNAGNPIELDTTGDNSPFIEQILLSNNYMFSNLTPLPRINQYNFAINERCYDITNINSQYDPSMIDNKNYNWNVGTINADTALGMCDIHENRYIGKAAYLYSFEPYAHSAEFLIGVNTKNAKQIDVIFNANPQSWFPRPQTMYIYTRSSNIIEYSRNGVINVNR